MSYTTGHIQWFASICVHFIFGVNRLRFEDAKVQVKKFSLKKTRSNKPDVSRRFFVSHLVVWDTIKVSHLGKPFDVSQVARGVVQRELI